LPLLKFQPSYEQIVALDTDGYSLTN